MKNEKQNKYCLVNISSAMECSRFDGIEFGFRSVGKLTTGCKGDGNKFFRQNFNINNHGS